MTQKSFDMTRTTRTTRSIPTRVALAAAIAFSLLPRISVAQPASATHDTGYAVAQRYPLGGNERWDYLGYDSVRNRLFISRANHVQVVAPDTGKQIGEIADTDGVHGFAFVQARKLGFISNGRANTLTVFDLDTLKTLATLPSGGRDPDSILYVPELNRLFTSNGHDASVSVYDVATRKLVATLPVGGKPETLAAGAHGRVYVNVEDKGEIAEIDGTTNRVLAHWSIAPCEEPSGLASDPKHGRLYAVCDNERMMVVDDRSGRTIATVPIGAGPDAVAFDPSTNTIFSSNGKDGTLTIVHEDDPDHYTVRQTVATQVGARTLALDTSRRRVFLVSSQFDPLAPAASSASGTPPARPTVRPGTFNLLVVQPTPATK
jgi:YVTN family beta-propeller protein